MGAWRLVRRFVGRPGPSGPPVLPAEVLRRVLDRERGRAERGGGHLSLVSFRTDGGEASTARVASALLGRVRFTDAVGSLGPSRIGVVLPGTGTEGARHFAGEVARSLSAEGITVRYRVHALPPEPGAADGPRDHEGPREAGRDSGDIGPLMAKAVPPWKRAMDVAVAALVLATLSPLMAAVAVLIKLSSRGPVLFRQPRIGLGGRTFTFLKFRSMHVACGDAAHRDHLRGLIHSARPMHKLKADPRVFPLGAFLRRTYLDELPQLLNVLLGQMSLVGPRPCLAYEAAEYSRWHARRFDVAPGMTGLWQVSGKNRLAFNQMARLDIEYCRRLSPWRDLGILVRTPLTVMRGLVPAGGNGRAEENEGRA